MGHYNLAQLISLQVVDGDSVLLYYIWFIYSSLVAVMC